MSQRLLERGRALALAGTVAVVGLGVVRTADAADLPRRDLSRAPYATPYTPPPYRPVEGAAAPDDRPASYHGYYGYYGYDIGLVPYEGLYSATVTCLRSVKTRYGYVTVDVCDR